MARFLQLTVAKGLQIFSSALGRLKVHQVHRLENISSQKCEYRKIVPISLKCTNKYVVHGLVPQTKKSEKHLSLGCKVAQLTGLSLFLPLLLESRVRATVILLLFFFFPFSLSLVCSSLSTILYVYCAPEEVCQCLILVGKKRTRFISSFYSILVSPAKEKLAPDSRVRR